jgi:hypothetical protein
MLCVKHSIVSAAAAAGGVFGYLTAPAGLVAGVSSFGFMLVCAGVADWITRPMEVDEDDELEGPDD